MPPAALSPAAASASRCLSWRPCALPWCGKPSSGSRRSCRSAAADFLPGRLLRRLGGGIAQSSPAPPNGSPASLEAFFDLDLAFDFFATFAGASAGLSPSPAASCANGLVSPAGFSAPAAAGFSGAAFSGRLGGSTPNGLPSATALSAAGAAAAGFSAAAGATAGFSGLVWPRASRLVWLPEERQTDRCQLPPASQPVQPRASRWCGCRRSGNGSPQLPAGFAAGAAAGFSAGVAAGGAANGSAQLPPASQPVQPPVSRLVWLPEERQRDRRRLPPAWPLAAAAGFSAGVAAGGAAKGSGRLPPASRPVRPAAVRLTGQRPSLAAGAGVAGVVVALAPMGRRGGAPQELSRGGRGRRAAGVVAGTAGVAGVVAGADFVANGSSVAGGAALVAGTGGGTPVSAGEAAGSAVLAGPGPARGSNTPGCSGTLTEVAGRCRPGRRRFPTDSSPGRVVGRTARHAPVPRAARRPAGPRSDSVPATRGRSPEFAPSAAGTL